MNFKERIYIVEDSYLVAHHLKMALEQEGYIVVGIADSGEKALDEIQSLMPDMALLDITLQGEIDGIQLATHLRNKTDIPFIYITALSDRSTVKQAKITEPYGYLTKPINENEIITTIEMALYRHAREKYIRNSERTLAAAIDNTSSLVWSVDKEFRLISMNRAFRDYLTSYYNIEPTLERRVVPKNTDCPTLGYLLNVWTSRYQKVLQDGKPVKIVEQDNGHTFEFSLSPIVEKEHVKGVSVFARELTPTTGLLESESMQDKSRISAVQKVLNPHFVFNALNSIQFYITAQEKAKAMHNLSSFSRLVRGILERAADDCIRLSDELELIGEYLELESMRFEGCFTYHIEVECTAALDEIKIPPFVIQPVLEQALMCCLRCPNSQGKIALTVKGDTDLVIVEIQDNGSLTGNGDQLGDQTPFSTYINDLAALTYGYPGITLQTARRSTGSKNGDTVRTLRLDLTRNCARIRVPNPPANQ